jgi:hypothetical protein
MHAQLFVMRVGLVLISAALNCYENNSCLRNRLLRCRAFFYVSRRKAAGNLTACGSVSDGALFELRQLWPAAEADKLF